MNGQVLQFNTDTTIITRYFAQTNPSNPNVSLVRTDIGTTDVTNSINAFNQVDATVPYNEGDVIIHPPNLQHGFESSSHTNRIALSFNVAPF